MLLHIFLGFLLISLVTARVPKINTEKAHNGLIGFTAWAQSIQFYGAGDTVIFTGFNVNEGSFYQPSVGRFYCPVDGVYFVTLNLRRVADYDTYVRVMLDETQDIFLIYDTQGVNDRNIASNSALVQCNQAQQISVMGAGDGAVFGETGIQHSTFSVILMSAGNSLVRHNDPVVGFSAYLGGDDVYYTANDMILFDGIIYNSGNYSSSEGAFTCPETGIYYINTNFQKYIDQPLQLGVSLDSLIILHSELAALDGNNFNTISNSRFIDCTEGQSLSVKALGAGTVHGGSRWTTWSVMYIGPKENTKKHNTFIGFSAFKSSHQSYTAGDVISFDTDLVNDGGHFDGSAFRCPQTAFYFVSVNFKKVLNYDIYLDVVQADVTMFRSEEDYTNNEFNTVSNSGIFRCIEGELVQVEAFASGSVHGDPVKTFTTFSVMLLYEIDIGIPLKESVESN